MSGTRPKPMAVVGLPAIYDIVFVSTPRILP